MAKRGRPKKIQRPRSSLMLAAGVEGSKDCVAGDGLAMVAVDEPALVDAEVVQVNGLSLGECSHQINLTEEVNRDHRVELPRSPYLQAVKNGVVGDCDQKIPNPLAGNLDTRRGLQLSNEEERETELIFIIDDVASEREYWSTALIGRWGHKVENCKAFKSGPSMAWRKKPLQPAFPIVSLKGNSQSVPGQTSGGGEHVLISALKKGLGERGGWQEVSSRKQGKQLPDASKSELYPRAVQGQLSRASYFEAISPLEGSDLRESRHTPELVDHDFRSMECKGFE
ncbi:hypothetical protein Dimus_031178 [Dionaea muscipula]